MARRLAAIMFTDLVGFTASAQVDEAATLSRLHEEEAILRPLFKPYGGREIKSTGDGFLIEFASALKATECAVEMQRQMRDRNAKSPTSPILLRIGIHVGDVEEVGGDILGDAVNIAARIHPFCDPGGVCLSEQVVPHLRNKLPAKLERLGQKSLKGVQEPVALYRVVLPGTVRGRSTERPSLPRLAVLPFANISPDFNDDYFADGLTEELISRLSRIRGLRVIARTSIGQYKGTEKPIAQIGSELGVESVLEGSVRKVGDQVRISVQLIDVRTEEHRWAETYDRKIEKVFEIQAELAERAASALQVELLESERAAIQERPTSSLVAYEAYLRGIQACQRFYLEGAGREDELNRRAIGHFEEAIREDPRFIEAYAYLANLLISLSGDVLPKEEVLPRVRELTARATELNPRSSEVHTAVGNLAMQFDRDWPGAEAELQQAISLNPSNAMAHFWYGVLLHRIQRFNEAVKQYRAAIELDPLWPPAKTNLAWNRAFCGDTESAIDDCHRLMERFPESERFRVLLAWIYVLAGRAEEALRLVEPMTGPGEAVITANRYGVLAYLGKPEGARAQLDLWRAGRSAKYMSRFDAAALYASLGEKESAIGLLAQDFRESRFPAWASCWGPYFDSIRRDPRFIALLREMKLPTTLARPTPLLHNSGPG